MEDNDRNTVCRYWKTCQFLRFSYHQTPTSQKRRILKKLDKFNSQPTTSDKMEMLTVHKYLLAP